MTNVLGKTLVQTDQILLTNKNNKNSEEEMHSFLTYSNRTEDDHLEHINNAPIKTLEKGLLFRARKTGGAFCKMSTNKCMGLYFLLTIVVLGITVMSLELSRSNETYTLRSQIDALRRDVDIMKHRLLEEDIIRNLKTFEDAVYAEEAVTEDNDDNDEDEYSDYDGYQDTGTSNEQLIDDHHAKHRNTELPTVYTDHHNENLIHDHNKRIKNNHEKIEKLSEGKRDEKRIKRNANYDQIDGSVLPVIAGSYGIANKTEGLRLYESLVSNSQEISVETTESPIKQHHRVSPLWSSKQHRKKYQQHQSHSDEDDSRQQSRQRLKSTQAPSPIISRPSRVMKTDKDPARRISHQSLPLSVVTEIAPPQELRETPGVVPKPHEGEIIFRVYQEQRAVPEATVRPMDVMERDPNRQRRRNSSKPMRRTAASSVEGVEEKPIAMRHRLLPAAHFNGDTSRYTQAHEHYDGNGRLRHPGGVFTDWSPSKWVAQLGMDKHFKFEDGAVNIRDTGLYLVYAQIHYLDEHDINGYRVYVNNDPMLQCTTMTHSRGTERVKKSNTCFTAAALFLTENDRLSLSDIGGLRYSIFEPAKSFFGLIKLGSINLK